MTIIVSLETPLASLETPLASLETTPISWLLGFSIILSCYHKHSVEKATCIIFLLHNDRSGTKSLQTYDFTTSSTHLANLQHISSPPMPKSSFLAPKNICTRRIHVQSTFFTQIHHIWHICMQKYQNHAVNACRRMISHDVDVDLLVCDIFRVHAYPKL